MQLFLDQQLHIRLDQSVTIFYSYSIYCYQYHPLFNKVCIFFNIFNLCPMGDNLCDTGK